MLAQGTRHLEQGNISAARSFFQNAADAGLAEAALRLGSTYDPVELPRLGTPTTLAGDAKEARRWYEKARDLGAAEAESRLGRLGGR
jgi:TPR repeat protein